MTKTSAEIRQAFLDYFEEQGHTIVASSSLVPHNDPTLLFTNAGMVQFKDTFLGLEKRAYTRAATSQKCMRVAGKHNDLENVGPSPRHHTFFEMLGNFSFGDYFKAGAIRFAYECLTKVYGIPADRLYYTVHIDDDEAFELWTQTMGIDPARVYRMGDKTNFWQMADVGPCGPTSELHYDWGVEACTCGQPDCSVLLDNGCDRWLEVWNLVFMQFNQKDDGSRQPLPAPGVDTGMGLERVISIVQNKTANYETDLFMPIINHVQQLLGHTEAQVQEHLIAYRVIADHGRAITFMIGDGVMPGNEGRASVLRLILRRAARYGRLAGFEGPFLAKVADKVIDEMGDHYIELKARRQFILNVITQEEERFLKTLTHGLELIATLAGKLQAQQKSEIPGDEVFKLYATYGFPKDLTRVIAAEEYGLTVDEAGYEVAFEEHTRVSGGDKIGEIAVDVLQVYADLLAGLKKAGTLPAFGVAYNPYGDLEMNATVLAILRDGQPVDTAAEGQKVELVLSGTPFYVEAGGQVSDTGQIGGTRNGAAGFAMTVENVAQPVGGLVVHAGIVTSGAIQVGQPVVAQVDPARRWNIRRNHTATHLLHRELRRALGGHVAQAGSLVAPDRLRFDFSHPQPISAAEREKIEAAVNQAILADLPVLDSQKKYDELKQAIGAGQIMALFGEKYGDVVRVVKIGDNEVYSQELCGGTHVQRTSQIGELHIVNEGSVSAGVRRIEAVTGAAAQALVQARLQTLDRTAGALGVKPEEVDQRVESLVNQLQQSDKRIKELERKLARAKFEQLLSEAHQVDGVNVVALKVDAPDESMLREMSDWFRDRLGSGVVVLGAVNAAGRPILIASVTDDLTKKGLHAGKIVKSVAQMVGGGGGGSPKMAQAGGKDPAKLTEALATVDALVAEAVG